ncbi:hypothetical protein Amet_0139 [Alkaliphilus metalliredigens QYMF]|uniref:Uncharacterized protein n=1 Tax=Alkaliphilus metalliredigens (strain QYMF) TaxID=293826 RepID=A6TJL0_ALKMQ|nr:hypothetical protein [Alkaliphilus metalliredigens]ABR46378.1 hypothetical protein Amet_0139 [Alkaliphilus metalliredigens QYMF]
MSRRYKRYFVMLEGEDRGFELSKSQEPKGYGKIEVRNEQGTLSLHCQNLKKVDPIGARYRWYLVNTRKTGEPIIVDIGPMEVDVNGKGELVWEFNGENVKGSNSKIDGFNILALVVEEKGEKKEFSAPLVGYIDKEKTGWKDYLAKHLSVPAKKSFEPIKESKRDSPKKDVALDPKEKPKPTLESKKEETKKLKPTLEPKEKPLDLKEKPLKKVPEKTPEKTPEKAQEKPTPTLESKDPKEKGQSPQENPVKDQGPRAPQVKQETPKIKVEKKEAEAVPHPKLKEEKEENIEAQKKNIESQNKGLQVYVESTLKGFPKADPFTKRFDDYQWWQIQYDQQTMYRSAMPFIGYIEGQHHPYYYYYPSEYQRLIYTYQHYLFGMSYDGDQGVKYYVYGIPGSKLPKDQPYRGSTGFTNWYSCNGDHTNPNTSGYWLLHIDAKTGEIATALK